MSFLNLLRNNRGLGMLQVLALSAAVGGFALIISKQQELQQQEILTSNLELEIRYLENHMTAILADERNCTQTFVGMAEDQPTGNLQSPAGGDIDFVTSNEAEFPFSDTRVSYAAGDEIMQGKMVITNIEFETFVQNPPNSEYRAKITLQNTDQSDKALSNVKYIFIPLVLDGELDTGDPATMGKCYAASEDLIDRAAEQAINRACRDQNGDINVANGGNVHVVRNFVDNGVDLPTCEHLEVSYQCPPGQYMFRIPNTPSDPQDTYCRDFDTTDTDNDYEIADSCANPGEFLNRTDTTGQMRCHTINLGASCADMSDKVITGFDSATGEFECTTVQARIAEVVATSSCPRDQMMVMTSSGLVCRNLSCPEGQLISGIDPSTGNPRCIPGEVDSCPANQYIAQIDVDGSVECANVPGNLTNENQFNSPLQPGQFILGINSDGSFTTTPNAIPNCNAPGEKLQWNSATSRWGCNNATTGGLIPIADSYTREQIEDRYLELLEDPRFFYASRGMDTSSWGTDNEFLGTQTEYPLCFLSGIFNFDNRRDSTEHGCMLELTSGGAWYLHAVHADSQDTFCQATCLRNNF
jgi:hypothetical protein